MSMRLIILGVLMEGEKHPYEIQQILLQRSMDRYIKFQKGSLYYAFQRLEKEGLIEVAEVIRDSNRPDRTVYRITDSGQQALQDMLTEQLQIVEPYYDPIYAALAFCRYADQDTLVSILEEKIKLVEKITSDMHKLCAAQQEILSPANFKIVQGGLVHTETELAWLRTVYEEAKAGHLV